jgi:hypothetical protein
MEFDRIDDESQHTYTDEEAETIAQQSATMLAIWNNMADVLRASAEYDGIHPPPALHEHMMSMVRGNNPLDPILLVAPRGENVTRALDLSLGNILAFGDALYRFGQYCASRGLRYGELIKCNCARVDAAALAASLVVWAEEQGGKSG